MVPISLTLAVTLVAFSISCRPISSLEDRAVTHMGHAGRHMHRLELVEQLLSTYDKRIPPNFEHDEALEVRCNLHIVALDSISIKTMDFRSSFFIRQKWNDPRLAYSHISNETMLTLDSRIADHIWTPDLIFITEKEGEVHDITVPNKLLRLYKNGDILYSIRLSLCISCSMGLQNFPLDTQDCGIEFESFGYTTDRLKLMWDDEDPVRINENMKLPEFKLSDIKIENCDKIYTHTGEFPCLNVGFVLTREVGFYMIQTFLPSALIVMLSWVSFWINADAVPGRVTLGVSTVLTITTQNAGSRQGLPHVSYVRAIDVWMTTCMAFVFAALVEYAFVNVFSRREIKKTVKISRNSMRSKGHAVGENGELIPMKKLNSTSSEKERIEYIRDPDGKRKARTLDKIARIVFPLTFTFFNAVYWPVYIL